MMIARALALSLLCTGFALTAASMAGAQQGSPPTAAFGGCYQRLYDSAHMASHPAQNVTVMTLSVDAEPPADGTAYAGRLRVDFRHALVRAYNAAGRCAPLRDGRLACALANGGIYRLRLASPRTVMLEIADLAPVNADVARQDPDAANIAEARFGSDDRVFRLDRVTPSTCADLGC